MQLDIFYLIYASTATQAMDESALMEILETSRVNNAAQDITGILLYRNGRFVQMLEGEQTSVLDLYTKICSDSRHNNVGTVMSGHTDLRNYGDWTMGFVNMDKQKLGQEYTEYVDQHLLAKKFSEQTKRAYTFLSAFHDFVR